MGIVVTYAPPGGDGVTEHEIAARVSVAKALAGLKGYRFGGGYQPTLRRNGALYFVPSQTLSGEEARALGIRGEEDLFGGVVPFPFAATKAIAHPLPGCAAFRPSGWCEAFPERVREVVLPGFSAFAREDAREAARLLLANGPVRLKRGRGIGGRGQAVIEALDDPVFDTLDETELRTYGLVVEPNLADLLTTFSVGQVCVGDLRASYCGTQKATHDNQGELVYGGSDLLVARGGFDELERLDFPPQVRIAIEQAKAFDAAAQDEFDGLFASRRNYDVLRGRDSSGRWLSGVLEQSWRIGGASGPEVAALAAFHVDARLRVVHARSSEAYDADATAPDGATVHFRGVDSRAGPITKYTLVEPYERAL